MLMIVLFMTRQRMGRTAATDKINCLLDLSSGRSIHPLAHLPIYSLTYPPAHPTSQPTTQAVSKPAVKTTSNLSIYRPPRSVTLMSSSVPSSLLSYSTLKRSYPASRKCMCVTLCAYCLLVFVCTFFCVCDVCFIPIYAY